MKGMLGAALVCAAVWTTMRLSGAPDRNRRLIALGFFWHLIALVPLFLIHSESEFPPRIQYPVGCNWGPTAQ